jgi:hypothetical protein
MKSICSRCEKNREIVAAVNEFLLCASCFKKVRDEMDRESYGLDDDDED